ncbi:uncharacterized protein LAJ45_02948 [Morchella importuna]|uniref:uncharacterized protein n=1 Tax=Morchella importuna TaxID=1174673 RepID=UPI001E8DC918|nr:uncharacterized protein LAJ45_02948 [Morchella importuna]KAH8152724.1 hypothetical protein LAJ45_02948 [Morchella importuna]
MSNIASGFRATGIWPYNPNIVLDSLMLPEPILDSQPVPSPPLLPASQTPQAHEMLTYQPRTPTTPRSIHHLYVECLTTITSSSPRSVKQRALFTKLKMGAEKCSVGAAMHEAGEEHLRKEIKQLTDKARHDTRRLKLNSS